MSRDDKTGGTASGTDFTGGKLTKRFGELTANREIDIEIHAGEIHAIAGENGAGKVR